MAKTSDKSNTNFDNSPQSSNDMQEQMALYMEQYNKNSVQLAGKVVSLQVGEAKPKLDKKTNEQVLVDGVPQFWEPFRSCEVIFEGGSLNINLNAENYEKMVIGNRFLFDGIMGLNYGKVQPVFHTVTQL